MDTKVLCFYDGFSCKIKRDTVIILWNWNNHNFTKFLFPFFCERKFLFFQTVVLELPKVCNVMASIFYGLFAAFPPMIFLYKKRNWPSFFLPITYKQRYFFHSIKIKCSMKVQNPIYFPHFIWKRAFMENESNYWMVLFLP